MYLAPQRTLRCFFVVKTALKWPIMAFWNRMSQICLERNEILITFAASKVTQTKYNMKLKQLHPNVGQIAGVPVYIIKASPEILAKRHFERADTQCERFLKGRRTKIENLRKKCYVG